MKSVSYVVAAGAKTNRVKSAGHVMKRYRADPAVRGKDTVVTAISMPAGELAALDAACERVQMARSHFIREACARFVAELAKAGSL